MLRALVAALVIAGAAGCGDGGNDNDMALCFPTVRTCGAKDVCGTACDPGTDTSCTDHSCSEPYFCDCRSGHWACTADNFPTCVPDMAQRLDLAVTD